MVQILIDYEDGLTCHAIHAPSGAKITTDAPVDNHGRGESFSPTDLVATALGSCMATIMGIVAERKGISLAGMQIEVRKIMSGDTPRRIGRLELDIKMPLPADHPHRELLANSALACPVHHSLHPDIDLQIDWTWAGTA
jgi:uncharacterized OsmC-like protein